MGSLDRILENGDDVGHHVTEGPRYGLQENSSNTSGFDNQSYIQEEMAGFEIGMERIIVPIAFSFVILFGFIGNIIVIIVVVRNKDHFRNTTNLFILNLSIADVLFLLFCVPFHSVIYTTSYWPFGVFLCKFVHLIQYSSMVASILTLVAMSVDRYMAVAYALETKHLRTPLVAFVLSCTIWVIALAVASPFPFVYKVAYYEHAGNICSDAWWTLRYKQTYYMFLLIFGYVLPTLTIFNFNIMIIRQLWLTKQPEGPRMKESINKKRKVTRLIIVVVLVFCICWLPSHIMWMWTNFFMASFQPSYAIYYFKIAAHFMSYSNSAVNPVIYAFLSANFRRGFQRAVLGRKPPVQRYVFTKSSPSSQAAMPHVMGYYNRYCNGTHEVPHSSYSDTCV